MFQDTVNTFVALAEKKCAFLKASPMRFFVASMLAGAYVGLGILLIFSVGTQVPVEFRKLVMGASFGIALTLVVIAGAELFTGHTMYGTFAYLKGRYRGCDIAATWSLSWLGNLCGSMLLAGLFVLGGGGGILDSTTSLVHTVATYKMNTPALQLFAKAILCNWLVCLALWMSARVDSDVAKCIVIFWCLFAFIAAGFEHSIANMTLLSLALLSEHSDKISWAGMFHNLFWVTLGNMVSGSLFVAGAYAYISLPPQNKSASDIPGEARSAGD